MIDFDVLADAYVNAKNIMSKKKQKDGLANLQKRYTLNK